MAQNDAGIPLQLAPPAELDNTDEDELSSDEKRDLRAYTEKMLVIPHVNVDGTCTGTYDVHRPGKQAYTVNPAELDESPTAMMCPDMQYRRPSGGCKHIRRIKALLQDGRLPARTEDATAYLDALTDTYEQLVEEHEELINWQCDLRQAKAKADGETADALEETLSDVVTRTGEVESLLQALEQAPAVEVPTSP